MSDSEVLSLETLEASLVGNLGLAVSVATARWCRSHVSLVCLVKTWEVMLSTRPFRRAPHSASFGNRRCRACVSRLSSVLRSWAFVGPWGNLHPNVFPASEKVRVGWTLFGLFLEGTTSKRRRRRGIPGLGPSENECPLVHGPTTRCPAPWERTTTPTCYKKSSITRKIKHCFVPSIVVQKWH
jgi:hypothetical protein